MRKIVLIFSLLFAGCVLDVRPIPPHGNVPIYEPDCSTAHLNISMPPLWSLEYCWGECCMYNYDNCQETYCYWVGDYDCYWELVEIYCW